MSLLLSIAGLAGVFLAAVLTTVGVLRYYDRRDQRARAAIMARLARTTPTQERAP